MKPNMDALGLKPLDFWEEYDMYNVSFKISHNSKLLLLDRLEPV